MTEPNTNPIPFAAANDPAVKKVEANEETVTMMFPHHVRLTLQDHSVMEFNPGPQQVPVSLKDHWYLKAHGVVEFTAPKQPDVDPRLVELARQLHADGLLEQFATYIKDPKALGAFFEKYPAGPSSYAELQKRVERERLEREEEERKRKAAEASVCTKKKGGKRCVLPVGHQGGHDYQAATSEPDDAED